MTSLGGGLQGISVRQTANSLRSGEDVMTRRVLRTSWNNSVVLNTGREIGAFRAANNLGDVLNRQNYSCGGPNQVNSRPGIHDKGGAIPQQCDGTGLAAASCNPKFVADSSDYIKFKKQRAVSQNYNDRKFGGDQSHASYSPLMRVRRR